ncbi:unnamed protein product [Discula destructiva]
MGVFEGKFVQWAHLIAYNSIFALLWSFIFAQTARTAVNNGLDRVYPVLRIPVLFTQTAAFMEVFHALIGLVHAPVLTTFVQVAGRCTVLWIVLEVYPSAAWSAFYTFMLLAWSAADVIRHLYFATRLVGGHQYSRLTWLRYSAFYVLYPVGIVSEMAVVYLAISEAWSLGYRGHAWGYMLAATLYIPAAPTLFNHMRRQRRKVLASKQKA